MEIGRAYDVVSLFSTPQRDFLIRNDGEKVKVDSLKGKIVAIFFVALKEDGYSYISQLTRSIKVVYDDLSPQNNFQVVLVALVSGGDECHDKKLFDKFFSGMPWLAIPQDDKESRRKLFSMIGSNWTPLCTILDDKGKILNPDAISDLRVFGAECYPFTPERIVEIRNDDMSARASISVKRLLTTPTRDFLIRNNSEKVPVSHLEGKVVAFYSYTGCEGTVDYLIDLYEKLREMGKQFEIVFINSRSKDETEDEDEDEKPFMEVFKRTPWLGLPSNDRSHLKLMRIFGCTIGGELVIVKPGEKFPDRYGLDVIKRYGIEAYPFTRKRVTEMEVERLKSLTLDSILFSGRHGKYIQGNGGQKFFQMDAHHLVNKTILLLFTEKRSSACQRLMPRLIKWYNETKERVEIIHIPYDYNPAKKSYYGTMPWLQFPYNEKYSQNLFGETLLGLYCGMPMVIAFGSDGKILTMNVHCKFLSDEEWESKIENPFTDNVDLFSEVEGYIASKLDWPVEGVNMQGKRKAMNKCPPWLMPGGGGG